MNHKFVYTNNYYACEYALDIAAKRDENQPCIIPFVGKWGTGKTTVLNRLYVDKDIFYITMQRIWRPRRMLEEICEVMNIGDSEYRLDRLHDQVCEGLKRWQKPLFIDEADYLLKNSVMLDIIRDIHDKTKTPIVLIGMEKLYRNLQKYGQFFSRILPAAVVEFQPVTPHEIIMITFEWTGLKLDPEAAELFCGYTEGDFRYIVGFLLSFEEACKANNTTEITVKMVESVFKRFSSKLRKPVGHKDFKKLKIVGKTASDK